MSAPQSDKKRDTQTHSRKEHVHRVLSAKQEEKIKNRWNQEEFICAPPFHNSLPMVPMGPTFKINNSSRPFSEFAAYRVTSLERDYIWQPHYGPDLNIKLDLVDQDSILILDKPGTGTGPADSRNILNSDRSRPIRGTSQDSKKHSWLKRTIYLTNDLGEVVKRTDVEKQQSENRKRSIGDDEGVCSKDCIDASFDSIDTRTRISLEKMKSNGVNNNARIEWMAPILPDSTRWSRDMNLILFDEDPEEVAVANDDIDHTVAKNQNRVLHSILSNSRALPSDNEAVNGHVIAVSLISPDSSILNDSSKNISNTDEDIEYSWMRDYKTHIRMNASVMDGTFILHADPLGRCAYYCPMSSKLEMKRLKVEDSDQHTANVMRYEEIEDK